jgi:hypothetical protein
MLSDMFGAQRLVVQQGKTSLRHSPSRSKELNEEKTNARFIGRKV